ncbi:MAG: hypothetical protein N0C84_01080 [Candidatus Thiodiazotropha taylori]|uniref:Uncharacterized protein n=1 Tax=Candidatus Thiodiazotropha taylori TaxID=2792791 RepID=A0A9E4N3J6_9GAMM|nr:hypothetical protein [Candidatus Thiodiazotropha taylori]MCW4255039.1 hypothetical protein [Candidatus Thiodiazotropha taylori]
MILDNLIEVTISNNGSFYRELGYGRCKQGDRINVNLKHLPINSNKILNVTCDKCAAGFRRSYQLLNKSCNHLCYSCAKKDVGNKNKGNQWGFTSKHSGENHPRWNPDSEVKKRFAQRVHYLSSKQPLHLLENYDKPRGLCGVKGAYQLDHIVSISKAYDLGWKPEEVANLTNLRFIPWKENRLKGEG